MKRLTIPVLLVVLTLFCATTMQTAHAWAGDDGALTVPPSTRHAPRNRVHFRIIGSSFREGSRASGRGAPWAKPIGPRPCQLLSYRGDQQLPVRRHSHPYQRKRKPGAAGMFLIRWSSEGVQRLSDALPRVAG